MFLFVVENKFKITGSGLILTPGLGDKVKFVKVGTEIKLVRPDKSELVCSIKGIMFEGNHDILISSEFADMDIPVGTQVCTND